MTEIKSTLSAVGHAISVAGAFYDALRWEQQLGILALIFAATAAVYYALLAHEARRIRDEAHALSRRLTALQALVQPTPPRECETYCRVCRAYTVTTETYCDVCALRGVATPLLLFSDALDMAAHMAQTFPLPATRDEGFAWKARGGWTH